MISRPQILVVDDEPVFRTSLADHLRLKRPGVDVLMAANGAKALEILRTQPVDILVTDVRMPELDGVGLMSALAEEKIDVEVVAMTAFGTSSLRSRILELGASTVLNKPLDIKELLEAIDSAMGDDQGRLRGISVAGFLQLIQAEGKSYSVEITTKVGVGSLFFDHGALVDASIGELAGMPAALELATWEDVEIRLDALPPKVMRRIDASLTHVLLEAARLVDEAQMPAAEAGKAQRMFAQMPAPAAAIEHDSSEEHRQLIRKAMERLELMRSFSAAALIESKSGKTLHVIGNVGNSDARSAAFRWMPVVEAEFQLLEKAGIDDNPEMLIVTTEEDRHLFRPIPDIGWLYVATKREGSSLALAWREVDATAELLRPFELEA